MKTSSPVHQCLILLFCIAGIGMFSCNQVAKPVPKSTPAALKKLDKVTLLKIVGSLSTTLSKKGSTANDGISLLRSYALNYDLMINGKPKHTPDTGYVYVNVTNDTTVTLFSFGLPQSLQKQITFADLKASYGPWILSPPAKEPISFGTMFYLDKDRHVSINAESKNLPEAKENLIEQITVMRLNP